MRVLSIKCAKVDLAWMVVEGNTRSDAVILVSDKARAPVGDRGEQLTWAGKELTEVLTKYTPCVAALAMSEGQSALAERSQMDGVVLSVLHQRQVTVAPLYSASVRSKFAVRKKEDVLAIVSALPACGPKTTAPQKELLALAAAILPR